jgi:hypothetical protein
VIGGSQLARAIISAVQGDAASNGQQSNWPFLVAKAALFADGVMTSTNFPSHDTAASHTGVSSSNSKGSAPTAHK